MQMCVTFMMFLTKYFYLFLYVLVTPVSRSKNSEKCHSFFWKLNLHLLQGDSRNPWFPIFPTRGCKRLFKVSPKAEKPLLPSLPLSSSIVLVVNRCA